MEETLLQGLVTFVVDLNFFETSWTSMLGLSKRNVDAIFDEVVDFSEIEQFIDTQVKFYSSGMYVRLAFAVAVNVEPDILVVDEVLAVGDERLQAKCVRSHQALSSKRGERFCSSRTTLIRCARSVIGQ